MSRLGWQAHRIVQLALLTTALALVMLAAAPTPACAEGDVLPVHEVTAAEALIDDAEVEETAEAGPAPADVAEEPSLESELPEPGEALHEATAEPILFEAPGENVVPIGRLYNKKTSEHLYTKNANEYNALATISNGDWVEEGVAWYAPATSNTPVYRLYNKRSGDHHYTTSKNERDVLVAKHGWTSEGIAFYSDDAKRLPLYRVYNPRLQRGQHHYTASVNERNALTSKHGWKSEGIGFYGVSMEDPRGAIFKELELNKTYMDLDVNCDGINDAFYPAPFQLWNNGYVRVNLEGRGAIIHYWKYDKTNVFIIVEVARNYGSYLKVMRCGPDAFPYVTPFTEALSVDLNDRNGVVGVSGRRLTVQSSEYRGGNARQITYELNPTTHTFRQV